MRKERKGDKMREIKRIIREKDLLSSVLGELDRIYGEPLPIRYGRPAPENLEI